MKTLDKFKTLSALKNDKEGLMNFLLSSNPKSAQIMNLFEQTKNGDLSSILPYLLSINKTRQASPPAKEKEQPKKASVQTKAQSFGLKPIANIATAQILKDIINLLD